MPNIKNRLGNRQNSIKARLGNNKRSVASVALRSVLDARQKINFNRVRSGRIGDARERIEARRRGPSPRQPVAMPMESRRQQPQQPRIQQPPRGLVSRGASEILSGRSQGVFARPSTSSMYPTYPREESLQLTRTIRNPTASYMEVDYESRIVVSNLQPSVTADDIVELFSDIGPLTGANITAPGQAEVSYARRADAARAIEAYHNRLLDGSAMRVFRASTYLSPRADASFTALKSAAGASMNFNKFPGKSSGIKIQPDIAAIHKVLFNPSGSGRGLFRM